MSKFAQVEEQVRQLPPEERARLAELLLESLVEVSSPSVTAAWDAEILERVRVRLSGRAALRADVDLAAAAAV